MARTWRDGDPPKFGAGTEMTVLLDILRSGTSQIDAVRRIRSMAVYRHVSRTGVSRFVYDARRHLARGDVAEAERRTHAFIHAAIGSRPEPAPAPRRSWLRRLLPWLTFACAPTALLITGLEIWR